VPALTLHVNGRRHVVDVDRDMPVLWVLRDRLGLPGTKFSCGVGLCGTCTVLIDGEAVRSCAMSVGEVGERQIVTIESVGVEMIEKLRSAWEAENVSQCGYCQPGQIMNAAALLMAKPHPTDDDIDAAMNGNLCRCGTYQRIRRAIRLAAEGR
jgi:isoquinoline 1-oxidoreductase alpha subunit